MVSLYSTSLLTGQNSAKLPCPQPSISYQLGSSELFHEILPNRPHTHALAKQIHWDGRENAGHLQPTDCNIYVLRTIFLKPLREEEGEGQPHHVCCASQSHFVT